MDSVLLDVAGHRRSPATMPGYHRGRPPRNKGEHYPADPPTVEEIVAVMRAVGDRADDPDHATTSKLTAAGSRPCSVAIAILGSTSVPVASRPSLSSDPVASSQPR
jgi:hypothetical protein